MNGRQAVCYLLVFGALTTGIRAQDLPPGPGREPVTTRCLSCHEADLIVQQRLTRTGWGRTLDKMARWGATVEPAEREAMLDYLSALYAPTPAASHLVATAGSEATYKRACLTCHEDDLIESQRLTRAGWVREVEKMVRWGAVVADSEKDALIDYLAARYAVR
jgi:cytochrome c553